MTKTKKIGYITTIILAIIGAFMLHPLASIAILVAGFMLLAD